MSRGPTCCRRWRGPASLLPSALIVLVILSPWPFSDLIRFVKSITERCSSLTSHNLLSSVSNETRSHPRIPGIESY
jgi:hypothetical protein